MLAFNETAEHYSQRAADLKNLPEDQRAAAQNALDKDFAPNFLEMQRFFSARAASLYPQDRIIAVKATFKHRPLVPFSARYASPAPEQPVQAELETSWLDYVAGVAR
jgi:hypothetical protein